MLFKKTLREHCHRLVLRRVTSLYGCAWCGLLQHLTVYSQPCRLPECEGVAHQLRSSCALLGRVYHLKGFAILSMCVPETKYLTLSRSLSSAGIIFWSGDFSEPICSLKSVHFLLFEPCIPLLPPFPREGKKKKEEEKQSFGASIRFLFMALVQGISFAS